MKTVADACLELVASKKYEPKNGETYCNFFVRDVAAAAKGYLSLRDLSANEQIRFMAFSPEWFEGPVDAAHAWAGQGKLVIAGHEEEGHGHVAIVLPGDMVMSGKWGACLPLIAQAGKSTFYGKPLSYGFTPEAKPRFYVLLDKGCPGGY